MNIGHFLQNTDKDVEKRKKFQLKIKENRKEEEKNMRRDDDDKELRMIAR
jgi:hypothetical protein